MSTLPPDLLSILSSLGVEAPPQRMLAALHAWARTLTARQWEAAQQHEQKTDEVLRLLQPPEDGQAPQSIETVLHYLEYLTQEQAELQAQLRAHQAEMVERLDRIEQLLAGQTRAPSRP